MSSLGLCLAIESATPMASVALLNEGTVLAQEQGPPGQHHSENLLPMVDRALLAADVGLSEVDCFAISIGPGAFTSLRIGLATLKGLAFGRDQPVAAVSTLQALALSAKRAGRIEGGGPIIVPMLDARRGEVYAAAYDEDSLSQAEAVEVLPSSVYSAAALVGALPKGGLFVGEGAAVVASSDVALDTDRFSVESGQPSVPHAVAVAILGRACIEAGRGVLADSLVPRYVRRAQAEAQRTSRALE